MRVHARLHDERGFGLLETVIAITIIFGSLVTLALSTTSGLKYFGVARERQAANQIANQLMEQTRGLAYQKITRGMQTSSLPGDPNLVTGCGDTVGTYRYVSCTGDRIVSTTLNCPTVSTDCATPIVCGDTACTTPNSGTIGKSSEYPVDYSWRTYVTNNCPAVGADCPRVTPYKVTVVVTWDDLDVGAGLAQRVTTQSLFWSPQGCVSSQTHPFAAPCQPFFYGQALAPEGQITVEGSVSGLDFTSGELTTTGAESTLQQEQVSQVQGSWTQTGTQLTTSAEAQVGGATSSSTAAADSDPSGTTPGYAPSMPYTGVASSLIAGSGTVQMQFTNAAGDTGQAIGATSAGGANVCPPTPPAPPEEIDLAPCGGSRVLQAGTSQSIGHFHGLVIDLGDATLASIANPTTATTTFANRVLVSGQNGNVQNTVSRYIGTVQVGGLPSNVPGPANWAGYFLQLSSYSDTVVSTAGTSAAEPTATVNAGTISYWDGTGYMSMNLDPATGYSPLSGLVLDHTTTVGVSTVRVRIGSNGTIAMQSVPTKTSSPAGSGSILRNTAEAAIGSPVFGTFDYDVWVNGAQVVDLTINVALGATTAKSIYQPAPSAAA